MNKGNFRLRYLMDRLMKGLILSIILTIIGMKFEKQIEMEAGCFFIAVALSVNVIHRIFENEKEDFKIPSGNELMSIIKLVIIMFIITVSLKPIILKNFSMLIIIAEIVIVGILKVSKKSEEDRVAWIKDNIEEEYDEKKISLFWRYKRVKLPKYELYGDVECYEKVNAFNKLFDIGVIWMIGQAIGKENFSLLVGVPLYIIFSKETLFIIDKIFKNYVYIDGICTGVMEASRENDNNIRVSIVDFKNGIEVIVKIPKDDIDIIKTNRKIRVVHGAMSKKVILIKRVFV